MEGRSLGDTRTDRLLEGVVVCRVLGVQTRLFDKLPEAFTQVQLRRVGWQEQQLKAEAAGQSRDQVAALLPGIIQDDRERDARRGAGQQP